uniref:outer membrane beta-barrel protein n=1 Tax=Edaphosphingomonas laterariae TaxID=861865 RepID=UPI0015C68A60|nr:outer membrane beta-barrel protein [Sphingomonas laterariae]
MFIPGTSNAQPWQLGPPESLLAPATPTGIRVGTLIALPQIGVDGRYDTNIFNSTEDKADDLVVVVDPSLTLNSDWARHAASLWLAAEIRSYADNTGENSTQLFGALSGRIDLGDRLTAAPAVSIARRIEGRGTFGDELTDEPISYVHKQAQFRLARTGGRLEVALTAQAADYDYEDSSLNGVPIDLSYRDLGYYAGSARADFRVSSRVGFFVSGTVDKFDYRLQTAQPRDSKGYSLLGGATMRVSGLLELEAAVGFVHQNFDDPLAKDFSGFDFHVAGKWTPYPRIAVAVEGRRSVERSPTIEAAGVIETRVAVGGQYALGNRILLGLQAGYVSDDFRGVDRHDRRLTGEATVEYRMSAASAFAGVGYRKQWSSGVDGIPYSGASFRLGVKLHSPSRLFRG